MLYKTCHFFGEEDQNRSFLRIRSVKVLAVFRKAIDIALPLWSIFLNRQGFLSNELIML
ncbi:hypothetical protein Slin_2224 [Spirosoma linguale DSM 74]|uniref:Uncharacterized protein n=1 Tax=Spirosoma linguale (strain ATCC 33905 / DSM 74 / LMG 10896 / Claus 1) TaxID=504472 RepID=D2QEJ4_SPILD|nr:hypothetical protein Slin_2224 [Spirosoma linguale DSM 74]